jgi:hypothetical protein
LVKINTEVLKKKKLALNFGHFLKMPRVNNCENSPNLITLVHPKENIVATIC